MSSEHTDRKIPPRLLPVRESALNLSKSSQTAFKEFAFNPGYFDESKTIMERIAAAETRRLFHTALPQFAHLLPELIQLPGRTEGGRSRRYFVPQTNEYYEAPDSNKYTEGAQMALFDPNYREFLGLTRVRELTDTRRNSGQEFSSPTLWGSLQQLRWEQEAEEPFGLWAQRDLCLTEEDIESINKKSIYYVAGLPAEEVYKQLLKNIRAAQNKRDTALTQTVDKHGEILKTAALDFCRHCVQALEFIGYGKAPNILRLESILYSGLAAGRHDAFLDIKTGSLTIVPVTKVKRLWKTFYIPEEDYRYEARNKEWCYLSLTLYAKAKNLLEAKLDPSTRKTVLGDIQIPYRLYDLFQVNNRIPFYDSTKPTQ